MFYNEIKAFVQNSDDISLKHLSFKGNSTTFTANMPTTYSGLTVKVSYGKGNWADITWIGFLGKGQQIQKGIYPVLLYYRKVNVLVLAYGVSATFPPTYNWSLNNPITIKEYFKKHAIKTSHKYDDSYIFSVYSGSSFNQSIDNDLNVLIQQYSSFMANKQIINNPTVSPITTSGKQISSQIIDYPKNIILYGPPGTGKTYNTIRYAVAIAEGIAFNNIVDDQYTDNSGHTKTVKDTFNALSEPPTGTDPRIVFTTFHQSLSYEDFIEGIKPKIEEDAATKKKSVYYDKEAGLFKRICDAARGKNENYVLIIDEINRGNVAQIFGELITLIEEDKREGAENELWCTLPYSGDRFCVPSNLYLLGTMNTADRSVEALDSALRRRFHFIEMMPNSALITKASRCNEVFAVINKRISILKDSEHQIGHSYFLKVHSDEDLRDVFRFNIIPLLQEYFFGDIEKMKMVLGEGFFVKETIDPKKDFPYRSGDIDIPTAVYRLWGKEEWENCATTPKMFTDARDKMIDG